MALEFTRNFDFNGLNNRQSDNMTNLTAPEKIKIDPHADGISCNGGGGALGHPKVWYSFDDKNTIECSYCDRLFVKSS